jgi:hypothetical protein
MYFWPLKAFGLGLKGGQIGVPQQALPNLEGKLKLHKVSIWWQV